MPVERAARPRLISGPMMGAAGAVHALLVPPKPCAPAEAQLPPPAPLCLGALFPNCRKPRGDTVSLIFKPAQYCEEIILLLKINF